MMHSWAGYAYDPEQGCGWLHSYDQGCTATTWFCVEENPWLPWSLPSIEEEAAPRQPKPRQREPRSWRQNRLSIEDEAAPRQPEPRQPEPRQPEPSIEVQPAYTLTMSECATAAQQSADCAILLAISEGGLPGWTARATLQEARGQLWAPLSIDSAVRTVKTVKAALAQCPKENSQFYAAIGQATKRSRDYLVWATVCEVSDLSDRNSFIEQLQQAWGSDLSVNELSSILSVHGKVVAPRFSTAFTSNATSQAALRRCNKRPRQARAAARQEGADRVTSWSEFRQAITSSQAD
jgi:hypothetical protein